MFICVFSHDVKIICKVHYVLQTYDKLFQKDIDNVSLPGYIKVNCLLYNINKFPR